MVKGPKDQRAAQVPRSGQKQATLLLENIRHPSLRAKKYDEAHDIWQARINENCRFYFQIKGDTYYRLNITSHPK